MMHHIGVINTNIGIFPGANGCRLTWHGLLLAVVLFQLIGCSLPANTIVDRAEGYSEVVSTGNFKHFLAFNKHYQKNGAVVVYIEGDGTPWKTTRQVAIDPTPHNPLLLDWFLTSNFSSVYLGRPCYFDLDDGQCSSYWYTHGRYSQRVVASMVEVLEQQLQEESLILVGHSGGGTLAMLMAEQLNNVSMVVTIAGNLNVTAWAEYHQYSPLIGSLDPMVDLMLPTSIKQAHFYSPYDDVIRAVWVKSFALKQTNVQLIEIPVKGHSEEWMLYQQELMTFLKDEWLRVGAERQQKAIDAGS